MQAEHSPPMQIEHSPPMQAEHSPRGAIAYRLSPSDAVVLAHGAAIGHGRDVVTDDALD